MCHVCSADTGVWCGQIALRDEGAAVFVKFLTAVLPGSRWDIAGEATVGEDDDDGEEDE